MIDLQRITDSNLFIEEHVPFICLLLCLLEQLCSMLLSSKMQALCIFARVVSACFIFPSIANRIISPLSFSPFFFPPLALVVSC